jgi:HD superfamily phosphohydrolase
MSIDKNKKYTFLDTVHGPIEIDARLPVENLILHLIETPEFQRLRRVKQLGFTYLTYYGAEGSRFVHSIGAFHVARRILNVLSEKYPKEVNANRLEILLAALLHDVGHGPFSHSSEPAFSFEHENWTIKNILGKTQINQVLKSFESSLPQKVAKVLSGNASNSWVSQLISGQIDCDRADYLLRDSQQTGTKYGVFQLDRIIQSMELVEFKGDVKLAVSEKGLNAIEDYLFARYSMYLQVYHHKKTLAADALFQSLIQRIIDLIDAEKTVQMEKSLFNWLPSRRDKMTLKDFCDVDDVNVLFHLKRWSNSENDDVILKDLSSRIVNRRLFKAKKLATLSKQELAKIEKSLKPSERPYYFIQKQCKEFPYGDYRK